MKTVLMIIGGMADLPDPALPSQTPLGSASVPSLDLIRERGKATGFMTVSPYFEANTKNAVLSILGYDLEKGIPSDKDLIDFSYEEPDLTAPGDSIRYFIIPGFSGNGIAITPSPLVKGIAKCALLDTVDLYTPGISERDILDAMAMMATEAIMNYEFVMIYVDSPLRASMAGDPAAKSKALELIDYHLVTPVADFIWKSNFFINMAVTSDTIASWKMRAQFPGAVPLVIYYNDKEESSSAKFIENECIHSDDLYFPRPGDLIRQLTDSPFPSGAEPSF